MITSSAAARALSVSRPKLGGQSSRMNSKSCLAASMWLRVSPLSGDCRKKGAVWQATDQIKKASPWQGSFLFCFGDPSWSQDPKRLEDFRTLRLPARGHAPASEKTGEEGYFFDL